MFRHKSTGEVLTHRQWQSKLQISFHYERPPAELELYVLPDYGPGLPDLNDYKQDAQRQMVHIFNRLADDIAGHYPWFERDTWQDQEYEALTYQSWVNNGSSGTAPNTPTLTGISTARGITLPDLVARVIANAAAWRQEAPQLAGQRQAYSDQIEAAADHAAVDSVIEFARTAIANQTA